MSDARNNPNVARIFPNNLKALIEQAADCVNWQIAPDGTIYIKNIRVDIDSRAKLERLEEVSDKTYVTFNNSIDWRTPYQGCFIAQGELKRIIADRFAAYYEQLATDTYHYKSLADCIAKELPWQENEGRFTLDISTIDQATLDSVMALSAKCSEDAILTFTPQGQGKGQYEAHGMLHDLITQYRNQQQCSDAPECAAKTEARGELIEANTLFADEHRVRRSKLAELKPNQIKEPVAKIKDWKERIRPNSISQDAGIKL